MSLGDIDLNHILLEDSEDTNSEDDDSTDVNFDDSGVGYESDELRFNDRGNRSSVRDVFKEKWLFGSSVGDCPLDKLVEDENPIDICEDDVVGMEFASIEAAKVFYRKYSLYVGFGVRRDDMKKNGNKVVVIRRWVCSRAGVRAVRPVGDRNVKKRNERPVTRVRCQAAMKVKLEKKSGRYVVYGFNHLHNHELVCPYQMQFVRANRNVPSGALATAVTMRRVGISTRQIMEMFVQQCGGYEFVGFTKKDLQNALDDFGYGEIETSDAETMLSYFRAKGQVDNELFVRYSVDESNTLRNLFWADSMSRYDYGCFGDVVGFDSTYNKNKYKKPVVMMIGTNSHWRTTIYGVVVLANESFESYVWLLETFLDAMYGKNPVKVITDGDKAMRAAVRAIFPNSYHRLCAWHLCKNAQKHVRNRKFLSELGVFMYGDLSVPEFERRWRMDVTGLNLGCNRWVRRMYKMRRMWAAAYVKGTFFAGMRTTQRCESLNGILKKQFNRRFKLHQLVEEIDRVLLRIRNNELRDDYKSRHTSVTLATPLQMYERHASRLFTRPIFVMVRDEIVDVQDLVVEFMEFRGGVHMYVVRRFMKEQKEWLVHVDVHLGAMKCSCKLFESEGLPCSHTFAVLRARHEKCIPDSVVSRRWMLDAKPECSFGLNGSPSTTEKVKELSRFGSLSVVANRACFVASQDPTKYDQLLDFLNGVSAGGQEEGESSQRYSAGFGAEDPGEGDGVVGDPPSRRSKGAEKKRKGIARKQYRCGRCQSYGHNSKNCLKNRGCNGGPAARGNRDQTDIYGNMGEPCDDVWDEVDAVYGCVRAMSDATCGLSI